MLKTLMLMALVSAQRVQSLHLLRLDTMLTAPDQISVIIQGMIKQSRPGTPNPVVEFRAYPSETRLCAMTLLSYMDTTKILEGDEKPCGSVIKNLMVG